MTQPKSTNSSTTATESEFTQGQCAPLVGCGCIGHVFTNVHHMVACCDVPHITEAEFWAPYAKEEDVD